MHGGPACFFFSFPESRSSLGCSLRTSLGLVSLVRNAAVQISRLPSEATGARREERREAQQGHGTGGVAVSRKGPEDRRSNRKLR